MPPSDTTALSSVIVTYGKFADPLLTLAKTVAGPAFQAGVCGSPPSPVPIRASWALIFASKGTSTLEIPCGL